jgi:hypothetical protein
MGSTKRIIVAASILSLGLALGGCADFDLDKIGDKLDPFGLTKKKPLPGERKDVFPSGVPGVSQGVPPELTRGYQAPAAEPDPAEVAAAKAAEEAAAKPKPKPKPKQTAKATPPKPRVQQQQAGQSQQQQPATSAQAPWPAQQPQQQQAPQQAQAPWPSQQSQPQQSTSPWPGSR